MNDIFILDVTITWWLSLLRGILAFIDFIVYGVIQVFFRTIFNLANFELVGFYEGIEQRVYVVLGIFMLFKVTISMLTYLVNPDKITDKEQGMSKVVVRIITVLIMLIALPTAFNLMTEFQNKLLPVIPRVIVGTTTTLNGDSIGEVASDMSNTMIRGFAHAKEECGGQELEGLTDFLTHINDPCSDSNNTYKYDYLPIVSTVVGVLMIYVLFSLCISTAIRAFKLIILRAMAPIPIISYVDPKSSKNGMFSTWTKTFLSVWAELFVLIGTIYFIVYMIDFLLSGDAWKGFFDGIGNPVEGVILLAFILIGLLFFAQDAPKFVFDALGIKNKGAFTRMLGMGATALGMGGNVASQFAARQKENPGHGLSNFGASLFGGLASGAAGGHALLSSDKPTWHTGTDQIEKSKAIALGRIEGHSTMGGRLLAGAENILGIPTRYQRLNNKIKDYEAATSAYKRMDSAFNSDGEHNYSLDFSKLKDSDGNTLTSDFVVNGETLLKMGASYSTKSLNDLLVRMKDSGMYTQEQIDIVDQAKKQAQQASYDTIRNTTDPSQLHGVEHEIYEAISTIYSIGKKYQDNDDQVFKDYQNAANLADPDLKLSSIVKKAAYGAGREADVIKSSAEYIAADADAKRQRGN